MLDTFACAECNRCTVVCPANSTGKPLDPAKIVHDMKDNLYANEVNLVAWAQAGRQGTSEVIKPLIAADGSGSVHIDELWSCTTCGACMQECPYSPAYRRRRWYNSTVHQYAQSPSHRLRSAA